MAKGIKQRIKNAYSIPPPQRREEFLATLAYPKSRFFEFVWYQAGYISKKTWVLSVLLVMAIVTILLSNPDLLAVNNLWLVPSLLPFLVLLLMTELSRSQTYSMEELECSCKYHLSQIVLVRLALLTVFNTFLLLPVVWLVKLQSGYLIGRVLAYLLLPFFLTAVLSLAVLSLVRVREYNYVCGGISFLVATLSGGISLWSKAAYAGKYVAIWELVLVILIAAAMLETMLLRRRMEEMEWSLSWSK